MKRITAIVLLLFCAAALAQYAGVVPATWRASAASTSTYTQADQTNIPYRGIEVNINISAYTSGNFTVHIQGKDPASGQYYDKCVGTALSATGTTTIKMGPGIAALANASCQDSLPGVWRIQVVAAGGPSATYSLGGYLFPQ